VCRFLPLSLPVMPLTTASGTSGLCVPDSVLELITGVEMLKKVFTSMVRWILLWHQVVRFHWNVMLPLMIYLLKQAFGFKLFCKLYYMRLTCNNFSWTSYLWYCMVYALCFCILALSRISWYDLGRWFPSFLRWVYHSWYQSLIGVKHTLKHLKITTMLSVRNA
jgi:hypothetical protein